MSRSIYKHQADNTEWDAKFSNSSVEYFAELVAQECARVIEEHAKLFPEADTTWRCAMIESAKVVKDNFRS